MRLRLIACRSSSSPLSPQSLAFPFLPRGGVRVRRRILGDGWVGARASRSRMDGLGLLDRIGLDWTGLKPGNRITLVGGMNRCMYLYISSLCIYLGPHQICEAVLSLVLVR